MNEYLDDEEEDDSNQLLVPVSLSQELIIAQAPYDEALRREIFYGLKEYLWIVDCSWWGLFGHLVSLCVEDLKVTYLKVKPVNKAVIAVSILTRLNLLLSPRIPFGA
ncbi:hypothetical protein BpHYR1_029969 [Brachionus plicatilis]|uniref:Uncharacterized protein n=1 Tax=Brachionus plicatilis TaxID=10195 RepID=A0A3M7RWL5_BRAPC|nr:hypothetical protein BpHYR1_029969 [Brachionus plicatilis]